MFKLPDGAAAIVRVARVEKDTPMVVLYGVGARLDESPELLLPRLLDEYRQAREDRLKNAAKSVQTASALVLCSLQKRLLSSVEAFACTLRVHRRSFEAAVSAAGASHQTGSEQAHPNLAQLKLLTNAPDADDDRADASEDEVSAQDEPYEHTPRAHWEEYCTLENAKRAKEDVSAVIKELHVAAGLGQYPFIHGAGIGSLSAKPPNPALQGTRDKAARP